MEKPADTLTLVYTTRHDDDTFVWRLPGGLDEQARLAYAHAATCQVILHNEGGEIEPADWREIVRLIAAKEFEAATSYWQDCCREGTYIAWDFAVYPEGVVTEDEIAAQAQAALDCLPEDDDDDEEDDEDD